MTLEVPLTAGRAGALVAVQGKGAIPDTILVVDAALPALAYLDPVNDAALGAGRALDLVLTGLLHALAVLTELRARAVTVLGARVRNLLTFVRHTLLTVALAV